MVPVSLSSMMSHWSISTNVIVGVRVDWAVALTALTLALLPWVFLMASDPLDHLSHVEAIDPIP